MRSPMGNTKAVHAATPASTDEIRWRALVARDARLDGAFVTGVFTTGIYCPPSCPARRPKRENVRFFDRPEEAERAGFRACLRCRPREVGRPHPHAGMVRQVVRILAENPEERFTLTALAREVGMSPHHLQRTFK